MPSISQYHREESEAVIPDAHGAGGEGVEPKPAERAATHPHPYKMFAKRDSAPCSTLKANCHFLSIGCWHSKVAFIWPHVLA